MIVPNVERMIQEAKKSPCQVIKFSASNGEFYSHNGEFYADCTNCKRKEIEMAYPDCNANHAEWSLLAKSKSGKGGISKNIWIYCMTPDDDGNWKDYPFKRFWCRTCAILLPMFGIKDVYLWDNEWIHHNAENLIKEVNNKAGEL